METYSYITKRQIDNALTPGQNVILIRGAQGSGKSTLGRAFTRGHNSILIETDQYFTDSKGNYSWDPSLIAEAHEDCFNRFKKAFECYNVIVVANTFALRRHIDPYIKYATLRGANVIVYRLTQTRENIHNAPERVVRATKLKLADPANRIKDENIVLGLLKVVE